MDQAKKTLFFDIQNVLFFFDVKKMHKQIADYCKIKEPEVEELLQTTGWGEMYERGEIDSRTLFHYLPAHIQGDQGFSGWFDAISNVFEPNDLITPVIKKLKQNGMNLCICSNICEAHFSYAYTHFSSLHLFDEYILSYEVKAKKPEEKMYACALEKAKTTKENAFFIEGLDEYTKKAHLLHIDSETYINPTSLLNELAKRELLN